MFTNFHVMFLAKARGMDILAAELNFTDSLGETLIPSDKIERYPEKRRDVVLSLVEHGYITFCALGETRYRVTDKAWEESLEGVEANPIDLDGREMYVGRPMNPTATWLNLPEIRAALTGLEEQEVHSEWKSVGDDARGMGLYLHFPVVEFSDVGGGVRGSWQELAVSVAGVSERVVGGIGEVFPTGKLSAEKVAIFYREELRAVEEGIEELSFREDAILVFLAKVSTFGGWEEYLAACEEECGEDVS